MEDVLYGCLDDHITYIFLFTLNLSEVWVKCSVKDFNFFINQLGLVSNDDPRRNWAAYNSFILSVLQKRCGMSMWWEPCSRPIQLNKIYIVFSQAVTHPGTNTTRRCLTSCQWEIEIQTLIAPVGAFRNCLRQLCFKSKWRGIGYSFQLAITAPLY